MSERSCYPPIKFASFSEPTSSYIVRGDSNGCKNANTVVPGLCLSGICENEKCGHRKEGQ